ncbi:VOC family protein [Chitinophaga lutea]
MAMVNPYLNFNDACEEAFNLYKSVFGGEFSMVMRFGDTPPGNGCPDYTPAEAKKIMHMSLPIGSGTVLMGSDMPAEMGKVTNGNNFSVAVSADSREHADKIHAGLSAGGRADMPMGDAFWGDYFGAVTDKFGIQWMITHSPQR